MKKVFIFYWVSFLSLGLGLILNFIMAAQNCRTFAYGEAYIDYLYDKSKWLHEFNNAIYALSFIMIVAGFALAAFTFAATVRSRMPRLSIAIRMIVTLMIVLYFGAGMCMMIAG